jgi:multiple sugar transport system permease protein
VRALVLLPWALPTSVMALAWGWIFNDTFGVLNDLLARSGLLHAPVAWLGSPGTAMIAMIVADVWKTTPFVALIVLAGLQGIPRSVLDAARVDGASPAALLWYIVLPLARPACLVALAFRSAQAFGAFDLPYVLTGGGPAGGTETVSLYAYRAFFRYLDFGYGAAIAAVGSALALVIFAPLLIGARRSWRDA